METYRCDYCGFVFNANKLPERCPPEGCDSYARIITLDEYLLNKKKGKNMKKILLTQDEINLINHALGVYIGVIAKNTPPIEKEAPKYKDIFNQSLLIIGKLALAEEEKEG